MASRPVLEVKNLNVHFPRETGDLRVVRGLDFEVEKGRTLGIVGESGSGKSMTALALMGLVPEPGKVAGLISLNAQTISGLNEIDYEKIRGARISIVFQDPAGSLNPVMTIGEQMIETILQHRQVSLKEAGEIAIERLKKVDIPDSEKRLNDYPHQLSGGMKQRILIAMALACEPSCLILDEPTTALDVTVQSQILDLIEQIQKEFQTSVILISHDLGIVAEVADDVAIMYAGRFVEYGSLEKVLEFPRHPYTRGLLKSIPVKGNYKHQLETIRGLPPSPGALPSGCPFHPRCYRVIDCCPKEEPEMEIYGSQYAACWNIEAEK